MYLYNIGVNDPIALSHLTTNPATQIWHPATFHRKSLKNVFLSWLSKVFIFDFVKLVLVRLCMCLGKGVGGGRGIRGGTGKGFIRTFWMNDYDDKRTVMTIKKNTRNKIILLPISILKALEIYNIIYNIYRSTGYCQNVMLSLISMEWLEKWIRL